jgi:hypothetical protein
MAIKCVLLSELTNLPAHERERVLSDLVLSSPNGEARELDQRLNEYETRYEMSSKTMREKYRSGHLRETADICRWLILLNVKDQLVSSTS